MGNDEIKRNQVSADLENVQAEKRSAEQPEDFAGLNKSAQTADEVMDEDAVQAADAAIKNETAQAAADDPDLVLIKVEALSAEFWESAGGLSSMFHTIVPLSDDISRTVEF